MKEKNQRIRKHLTNRLQILNSNKMTKSKIIHQKTRKFLEKDEDILTIGCRFYKPP